MEKFLEIHKLRIPTYEEIKNLNSPISIKGIDFILNFLTKKTLDLDLIEYIRKKIYLENFFQKIKKY